MTEVADRRSSFLQYVADRLSQESQNVFPRRGGFSLRGCFW